MVSYTCDIDLTQLSLALSPGLSVQCIEYNFSSLNHLHCTINAMPLPELAPAQRAPTQLSHFSYNFLFLLFHSILLFFLFRLHFSYLYFCWYFLFSLPPFRFVRHFRIFSLLSSCNIYPTILKHHLPFVVCARSSHDPPQIYMLLSTKHIAVWARESCCTTIERRKIRQPQKKNSLSQSQPVLRMCLTNKKNIFCIFSLIQWVNLEVSRRVLLKRLSLLLESRVRLPFFLSLTRVDLVEFVKLKYFLQTIKAAVEF